jgi:adenylate kinase
MMRALLIGPPGAGKGTQASRLAAEWGVPHISTGDLLREAVAEGSDLGRRVQKILAEGALVADDLMADLLGERLRREDCSRGFVLDGYPRTERQVRDLDALLAGLGAPLERAIELRVPDDVVVKRLSGRRTCPKCKTVFSAALLSNGYRSLCAKCGAALVARADDEPETVARRLELYRSETRPVVEHYRASGQLAAVDGVGTPDEVTARLLAAARKSAA